MGLYSSQRLSAITDTETVWLLLASFLVTLTPARSRIKKSWTYEIWPHDATHACGCAVWTAQTPPPFRRLGGSDAIGELWDSLTDPSQSGQKLQSTVLPPGKRLPMVNEHAQSLVLSLFG